MYGYRMMKKILLVSIKQSSFQEYLNPLKQSEYTIFSSDPSDHSIESAIQNKPHLVIIDYSENMNPIEIRKSIQLRLKKYFMVFYLITNGHNPLNIREVYTHFDNHFEKPFDPYVLAAKIQISFKYITLIHHMAYINNKNHLKLIDLEEKTRSLEHHNNNLSMAQQSRENKLSNTPPENLSNDLEVAGQIQQEIVPTHVPNLKNFKMSYKYQLYGKIGGDFFNFYEISDKKFAILLADVSGHSIASAFVTTMIKTAVANYPNFLSSPKKIMYIINTQLNKKIQHNFVTAIYMVIDLENYNITYSTAGHPPILYYHKQQDIVSEYTTDNTILGISESTHYEEKSFTLNKGDRIMIYTDGLYEVLDNNTNEIIEIQGLKEVFSDTREDDIDSLPNSIINKIKNRSQNKSFEDDVLVIALEAQ